MTSRGRNKQWEGPVDMNHNTSESIAILQHWDVTTPPPKGAKLSKFRSSKRHRRISLEMHRIPRDVNNTSLELADIFPDTPSMTSCINMTYDKAFFRISKYVPMKTNNNNNPSDESSVMSEVSTRTKDLFSKPDHEWRTKFLLQVSRVAITAIKNEKEVWFEAWDNGEVIERSIVFKTVSQAKEFSYDLERLAAEDPEMKEVNLPPNIISTPSKDNANQSKNRGFRPSVITETVEDLENPNTEVGVGHHSTTHQPTNNHRSSTNNTRRRDRRCFRKWSPNFSFTIANIFHFFGISIALILFFYAMAVYIKPDPLVTVATAICLYAIFIAINHGFGIMGTHDPVCGGTSCIWISVFLGIVTILLNISILVAFTVREDEVFDYMKDNYENLFLSEDDVDILHAHVFWIYFVMLVGSFSELIR
jgi:hypothetical protein